MADMNSSTDKESLDAQECRRRARQAMDLADRSTDMEEKGRFLREASRWLQRAVQPRS
jgi:hypothetical protein